MELKIRTECGESAHIWDDVYVLKCVFADRKGIDKLLLYRIRFSSVGYSNDHNLA